MIRGKQEARRGPLPLKRLVSAVAKRWQKAHFLSITYLISVFFPSIICIN